ncbi:MAG: hypothetical protein J4G12_05105 [Gemmatimonadetes bacterium]|nr:hypothetical protein [Gemmatimonadota bacterium]
MPLGSYSFHTGATSFFAISTEHARSLLPPHLQPVEVRHGRGVLSVSAFLFDDSVVGPYAELMFSVIVPPRAAPWGRHPKAGFFPFLAATSSEEARRIKGERLHFPFWNESIDAQFIEGDDYLRVRAFVDGAEVVDLRVTQGDWELATHILQGYMMRGNERLRATLHITGDYTVHEDEGGSMLVHPHSMTEKLTRGEIAERPFREHWIKNGIEVFHEVEAI